MRKLQGLIISDNQDKNEEFVQKEKTYAPFFAQLIPEKVRNVVIV